MSEGNRESSEITYEFTVDSVPPDFQTGDQDSSEESFIQEEVVEYLPAQPGVLEIGSPRKIPDLDSPKEHRSLALPPHSVLMEDSVDEPEQEEEVAKDYENNQVIGQFKSEEAKEPEKEEFVISLDELSNVDFSAMKPGEQPKPKRESDIPKVNYRIEFRSSRDSDRDYIEPVQRNDVHQEPVFYDDDDETDYVDGGVKNKCSELSFTPNSEGEAEHLLEEKSISMIALPAERTPVKKTLSYEDNPQADTSVNINYSPADSSGMSSEKSSPRREDSFDSPNVMQTQYQQLQDQFAVWQNQLVQNQKLLANSSGSDAQSGADDQSNLQLQQLQLQIQMQQQMLLQLQQSMQTLALQSTLVPQQPVTPQVPQTLPAEPVPKLTSTPAAPPPPAVPEPPIAPAPPAPQVAASKPKPSKADAKYTKPKQKRFERQLDPREQLMLDIRNFGKAHLKKVSLDSTMV